MISTIVSSASFYRSRKNEEMDEEEENYCICSTRIRGNGYQGHNNTSIFS